MGRYEFSFGEEAVFAFTRLDARQREQVLAIAEVVRRRPSLPGDYYELGASGRRYEVKLFDHFLLTWWTDHAAREVYFIRVEHID